MQIMKSPFKKKSGVWSLDWDKCWSPWNTLESYFKLERIILQGQFMRVMSCSKRHERRILFNLV